MNDYFENRPLNSKHLIVSPAYQRVVDNSRVKKIIANFNPLLVNSIKVSHRDNQYFIFDGQHTLAVLKANNNNKDLMVNCRVFEGLTEETEAGLFAKQTGLSRNVDISAKFKALFVAKDIDIVEMVKLTKQTGLRVDFNKSKSTNNIVALGKLYKIFKSVSAIDYIEILSVIEEAWKGIPESLYKEILGGVHLFCITYKGKYDRKVLIDKLVKVSPIVIKRDGNVYKTGGDQRYSTQIFDIYNKNLSVKRLKEIK